MISKGATVPDWFGFAFLADLSLVGLGRLVEVEVAISSSSLGSSSSESVRRTLVLPTFADGVDLPSTA